MTGLEIIPIMIASLAPNAFLANVLYLGTYAAMNGEAFFVGARR